MKKGRIAVTLSSRGIDTIAFLSSDKGEALEFYKTIEEDLQNLELAIVAKARNEGKEEEFN